LVIYKKAIAAAGAFTKVCSAKELLSPPLTLADEEKLFAAGGGNPGCSGRAGFSTTCVSVPSTGSLMTLFDGSKPPMLAMNNNIAAVAINMAVIVNAIVDRRFNK
jgi:hypothetical protein